MAPKDHRPSHNLENLPRNSLSRRAQEFTDATSLEVAGYIRGRKTSGVSLRSRQQSLRPPSTSPFHLTMSKNKFGFRFRPLGFPGRRPVGVSRLAVHPVGGGGL